MRDDTRNWDPVPHDGEPLIAQGVTLQRVAPQRQTIVSAPQALQQFKLALGPATEWPDIARGPSYAVSLRRDRVLLVDGPDIADGWHEGAKFAASDMTGGYAVFEMSGVAVPDILKRAGDFDLAHPSRSCGGMFGDFSVILYRFADPDRLRIHVPSAHAAPFQQLVAAYFARLGEPFD